MDIVNIKNSVNQSVELNIGKKNILIHTIKDETLFTRRLKFSLDRVITNRCNFHANMGPYMEGCTSIPYTIGSSDIYLLTIFVL